MESLWGKWSGKFKQGQELFGELSEDPELKWLQDVIKKKGVQMGGLYFGQYDTKTPVGSSIGHWDTQKDVFHPGGTQYESTPTFGLKYEFDPSSLWRKG